MSSTTIYKPGDVVVVNVPFTNQAAATPRPALVVSASEYHRARRDLVVCPISSQPRHYERPEQDAHPIRAWEQLGLRLPSTVRTLGIQSIEKSLIKRVLGRLASDDYEAVRVRLRAVFALE